MISKDKTVVVAMSGGIDSSVVAYILKSQGYEVLGLTLRMFCDKSLNQIDKKGCISDNIQQAKDIASDLGIEHVVMDVRDDFKRYVVDRFVNEYISGRTPNPCVVCNAKIKIPKLVEYAQKIGYRYVATGHYAVINTTGDNSLGLFRGIDKGKDQSYFLWMIPYDYFPYIMFPIGNMTKAEVRSLAEKIKLSNANKPESQEICFINNNNYISFLKACIPPDHKAFCRGHIIDENNRIIGTHQGYACYTIGQRKGIGGGNRQRLYVVYIDPNKNIIKVGSEKALYVDEVVITDCNFLCDRKRLNLGMDIDLQVRYRSSPIKGQIDDIQNDYVKIKFYTPAKAVTPGQSGVVYLQNQVLLGGVIKK